MTALLVTACGPERDLSPQRRAESVADSVEVIERAVTVTPARKVVLFVTSATAPTTAEQALKARLEGATLGFSVTYMNISGATSASVPSGTELVVFADGANTSNSISTTFRTMPYPVLALGELVLDDLGMTGTSSGTNYGFNSSQTQIAVTSGGQALANGLATGNHTVTSSAQTFGWGSPPTTATKVATIVGASSRTTIFGYTQGATMFNGTAPARRIGWFGKAGAIGALNTTGWGLFDAAVKWVTTADALLVVNSASTLTAGETAIKTQLENSTHKFSVRVVSSSVTANDATPAKLVVISDTAAASAGTNLKDSKTPILTLNNGTFNTLLLTNGTTSGTHFGTQTAQNRIDIVKPGHPLASTLTGTASITAGTATTTLQWAADSTLVPAQTGVTGAIKIATVTGNAARVVLFGYPKGAKLRGTSAQARRVGFFASASTFAGATPHTNAWTLFDAAVAWARNQAQDPVCETAVDNASGCSDGNACTRTDTCRNQVCVGSDLNTCALTCRAAGTCDTQTGLCTYGAPVADGTSCGAQACSAGACSAGGCVFSATASSCCQAAPSGLIGLWAAEGNTADAIGTRHGTRAASAPYSAGKFGSGFDIPGDTNSVSIRGTTPFPNQFTLEFWLRPKVTLDGQAVPFGIPLFHFEYTRPGDGGVGAHTIGLANNSALAEIAFDGGSERLHSQRRTWPANMPVHFAITYDGTTTKLYLDGVLESTAPTTRSLIGGSTSMLVRGDRTITDEIAIFDRPLSTTEIQARFVADRRTCVTNSCALSPAGCPVPVQVTVVDPAGTAMPSMSVRAYQGTTQVATATTNANGVATFSLVTGTYRFTANDSSRDWSSTDCSVPGCMAKTLEISGQVRVTVRTGANTPASGVWVRAWDGPTDTGLTGQTGADGVATMRLPRGSYRFGASNGSRAFYTSDVNHCAMPGCTTATILFPATSQPWVIVSPQELPPGGVADVYYGAIPSPAGTDVLALHRAGDTTGAALATVAATGAPSDAAKLVIRAGTAAGSYEVRYQRGATTVVTSPTFAVRAGGSVPVSCDGSHDNASCEDGNPCTTDDRCSGTSCIGKGPPLVCPGTGNECTTNRCQDFVGCVVQSTNEAQACGGAGCGGICMQGACTASSESCEPWVASDRSTAVAGEVIVASWGNRFQPHTGDWVGLFPAGSSSGDALTSAATNGTSEGTASFTVPQYLAPGNYVLRLIAGNTANVVATSGIITLSSFCAQQLDGTPCGGGGTDPCRIGDACMNGVCQYRGGAGATCNPPDEAAAAPEPSVGAAFTGVLSGQLAVSATGAATYTVPISLPPGVAGMVPNLALAYDSQRGAGVAGQGWELTGLSMIHRCSKTRVQDGRAEPATVDSFWGDGVCLDGKRLFARADGTYYLETEDFSSIGSLSLNDPAPVAGFFVRTKNGELRKYGSADRSRVPVPSNAGGTRKTAIWLLDTVSDRNGNYFTVHYNNDHGRDETDVGQMHTSDFVLNGITLTAVKYTGNDRASPVLSPFHEITFEYDPRRDVRHIRIGWLDVPRKKRLAAIVTPLGRYSLKYLDQTAPHLENDIDRATLPSRLSRIEYCTSGTGRQCLEPLEFGWKGGGYSWVEDDRFAPPFRIDRPAPGKALGGQFLDLNGDGFVDFVYARPHATFPNDYSAADISVWRNSVTGFSTAPESWRLPAPLVKTDNTPGLSRFADMDADGMLDLVGPPAAAKEPPRVWLNRLRTEGRWVLAALTAPQSIKDIWGTIDLTTSTYQLGDMDGDGRTDLVQFGTPGSGAINVFLNKPNGWEESPLIYSHAGTAGRRLIDANRDGLPDIVTEPWNNVYINMSPDGVLYPDGTRSPWQSSSSSILPWAPYGARFMGDVDGDGLHDAPTVYPYDQDGCAPEGQPRSVLANVGDGYMDGLLAGYVSSLDRYLPPAAVGYVNGICTKYKNRRNHLLGIADLNADGLVDFVVNHDTGELGKLADHERGGQLLVNTGTEWSDLYGAPARQSSGGPTGIAVPAVPPDNDPNGYAGHETLGAVFMDLNGDGVTDVARTHHENNVLVRKAWINRFEPPVITSFPNGLAKATTVSYGITREAPLEFVYDDTAPLEPGTTYLAVPLRVVTIIKAEDGTGKGVLANTTYRYSSLRGSANGRGPQGFRTISITESATNRSTVTTYAQAYPYTGLVTDVVKKTKGFPMSTTHTDYCDTVVKTNGALQCTLSTGPFGGAEYPRTGRPVFVYAKTITDTAHNWAAATETATSDDIATVSSFEYDEYGNPVRTTVAVNARRTGETHQKTTDYTYGEPGGGDAHKARGKVTRTVVTSQRTWPADGNNEPITRVTEFQYDWSVAAPAIPLKKKVEEPRRGAPLEVHTLYAYDEFGNVTTTTTCQDRFDDCSIGARSPDRTTNPPFRTTEVSYDPQDFSAPTNLGLISTVTYARGRFPVRTIDAARHVEYVAFDPQYGVPLQKTAVDGVHTCFGYDVFGRKTSETRGCGSATPFTTSITQYRVSDGRGAAVVTVTRPSIGPTVWTYTDVFGRSNRTLRRNFDGRFIESGFSTYDAAGRLKTENKPTTVSSSADSGADFSVSMEYDSLGRLKNVRTPLSVIDDSGIPVTDVVDTTYAKELAGTNGDAIIGPTVVTTRAVHGQTQIRSEAKNVVGKVSAVKDADGNVMTYLYDAEGNLTDTFDSVGNHTSFQYDLRGRKISMTDPDMGTWSYTYDGFGNLTAQKDAKGETVTMTYDDLGRMTTRTNAAGTAEWVYDVADGAGTGKLAAVLSAPDSTLANPCTIPFTSLTSYGNRAGRSFKYTALGEVEEVTECVDGTVLTTGYQYDAAGRQQIVTYPAVRGVRLAVEYHYTTTGFLHYITDTSDGSVYWAAKGVNALGQVTDEYTRNGVETSIWRNGATGWIMSSGSYAHRAQVDQIINFWEYRFDEAGNLRRRTRGDQIVENESVETFGYDPLNRLTSSRMEVAGRIHEAAFTYSAIGNVESKAGLEYTYGTCGAGPHAVCTIGGDASRVYDLNGNMTNDGKGRTITYDAANKPVHIVAGARSVDFVYGADGHRVLQETAGDGEVARTIYAGLGATGRSLYERTSRGGVIEHVQFLYAGDTHGGNAFALRVTTESSTQVATAMKYQHFDHLGSVTAVSDSFGHVVDEATAGPDAGVLGYDAWGARRSPEGDPADPASFNHQVGHREYTGHEAIPGTGLVNMNGRMYDPAVGRFLSPDPQVQFAADQQSYNRYSYVLNNPLKYTDPTGYRIPGWLNMTISAGIVVGGAAICAGSVGAGCGIGVAIVGALYTTNAMIINGATNEQIVTVNAIGMFAGAYGGAFANGLGGDILGQLVGGAISGAVSSAAMSALSGGDLGHSVIQGAAMGVASAALGMAARYVATVSQSSAVEAQGGGSGESIDDGVGAQRRGNYAVPCGQSGGPSCGDVRNRTPAQLSQDAQVFHDLVFGSTSDGQDTIFHRSQSDPREIVSIYTGGRGGVRKHIVEGPVGGTTVRWSVRLSPGERVLHVGHTHFAEPTGGAEFFSNVDVGQRRPLYVATPKVRFLIFEPSVRGPGTITDLTPMMYLNLLGAMR